MLKGLGTLALVFMLTVAHGGAPANARLAELKAADQADRDPEKIDWSVVSPRDAERRAEVRKLLAEGQIRTVADYLDAALIFQHGDEAEDNRLAHSFATIALNMDPGSRAARFLVAATWDRMMWRLKRPQWYATQYIRSEAGLWVLWDIDETAVPDEERKRMADRTIAESRALAERMNAERPPAK